MPSKLLPAAVVLSLLSAAAHAGEAVDLGVISRIRAEGFERSQVMETLHQLTDVIGPRLTGSPQARQANDWTRGRLAEWGLANAHLEKFAFGRGWSFTRANLRLLAPREVPLHALPKAWTPGTSGAVRGALVRVKIDSEEDLAAWKGKLSGKIVLLAETPPPDRRHSRSLPPDAPLDSEEAQIHRYTDAELRELVPVEPEGDGDDWRARAPKRYRLQKASDEFFVQEGVLAVLSLSSRANGILRVMGDNAWDKAAGSGGVANLVVARETYNSLGRLLDDGQPVELEADVSARFHDDDPNGYITVAEIPGTDPAGPAGSAGEVVMAGAHLDSWHGGNGATDNGIGCAVVMEAARILKALGLQPRRTVRVALWTGEEQGLLGSAAYVRAHFATRPPVTDPKQLELPERYREDTWPITTSPEHKKLVAYFNLDNGGGKVRGIYAEGNAALRPIFESWLEPLHDLGADTVTLRSTGSTDHVSFDRVGLPGFQFIQDEMDYSSRTHHTDLDVYDHISKKDAMQAAVVLATFLYDAANRPEALPRKALPTAPPPKKVKPGEEKDGKGHKAG